MTTGDVDAAGRDGPESARAAHGGGAEAAWIERCASRRAAVFDALGERGALVVAAAPEVRIGRDAELRYQVDPELYWLTGHADPEAVAVLVRDEDGDRFVLFARPRDEDAERWTGPREEPAATAERLGADEGLPTTQLREKLPALLRGVDTVHHRLRAGREDVDALVLDALESGRRRRQRKGAGAAILADPGLLLDDLRLLKDPLEVDRIRAAAGVSIAAFRAAAAAVHPGAGEWEVQAALEAEMRRLGASQPAFLSIVASGANAAVLHYVDNDRRMQAGDLLLVDAGARVDHYAADISRTWAVGGPIAGPRRVAWEAVARSLRAATAAVRPGATEADVHRAAVGELVAGLVELGVLAGDPAALVEDEDAWKAFFPHRTSHWLGLEVHDVGDYVRAGEPRVLQPGMVLTVEPGLYFPESLAGSGGLGALSGCGVRLEDDVLVTEDGGEVLTGELAVRLEAGG